MAGNAQLVSTNRQAAQTASTPSHPKLHDDYDA